jgi:uncharacterized membrane protein
MDVHLLALTYPSVAEADRALAAVEEAHPVDAVVVRRTPVGKIELRQTHEDSAGEGAITGGTVGLLAGLLLGIPVGAALIGVAAGAGWGARDTGIDDERLRTLGETLGEHEAMLCLLIEAGSRADVDRLLAPYDGVEVSVDLP